MSAERHLSYSSALYIYIYKSIAGLGGPPNTSPSAPVQRGTRYSLPRAHVA